MDKGGIGGLKPPQKGDAAKPVNLHRFQKLSPADEENRREAMRLHSIPTRDGALFLFREYSSTPEKFSLAQKRRTREARAEGREIFFIAPDDGSGEFVVKKERGPGDEHRHGERTCNLTLGEILVARALSGFADYEDEAFAIRFESPIGYLEDKLGQRFGLFEYMQGLDGSISSSRFESDLDPDMRHVSEVSDSYTGSDQDHREKLISLREHAWSILLPFHFSKIVLASNGIHHNESPGKDGAWFDAAGKVCVPILDFELCHLLSKDEIRSDLKFLTRRILGKDVAAYRDVIGDPGLESRLAAAFARMETRIKDYLGIRKLEDIDSLSDFGPAYGPLAGF